MFKQSLSPTGDVDEIWHEHILHTNKYALDCKKLFGKFLHHFPTPARWKAEQFCGVDGDEEPEEKLKKRSARTAIVTGCAGGECEGKCSNDTCDGGTTNCGNTCNADCSKRAAVAIDYDKPDMDKHPVAAKFSAVVNEFFTNA